MNKDAKKVQVGFSEASATAPATLSLTVPQGLARAELIDVIGRVLKRAELGRFRPRGCETCTSGVDLIIRERFEHILELDI